ncbi:hypothetical protein QP157_21410 [Sphingomonas sp. LR61]
MQVCDRAVLLGDGQQGPGQGAGPPVDGGGQQALPGREALSECVDADPRGVGDLIHVGPFHADIVQDHDRGADDLQTRLDRIADTLAGQGCEGVLPEPLQKCFRPRRVAAARDRSWVVGEQVEETGDVLDERVGGLERHGPFWECPLTGVIGGDFADVDVAWVLPDPGEPLPDVVVVALR